MVVNKACLRAMRVSVVYVIVVGFLCGCQDPLSLYSLEDIGHDELCSIVFDNDDQASLKRLLDKGYPVDMVMCEKSYGHDLCDGCYTPLMIACEQGAVRCLELLDKAGADYGKVTPAGRSVLHYAHRLDFDMAKQVSQKALAGGGVDINQRDNQGMTPLMYALRGGNLDFAKWLIEKGAKFDRWRNIGRGRRRSGFIDIMQSPYSTFEYVLDNVYSVESDEVGPDELLSGVDLHSADWRKRIEKLVSKGANLRNVRVGLKLMDNLVSCGYRVDVNDIRQLVAFGMPFECVQIKLASGGLEDRQIMALKDYLALDQCIDDPYNVDTMFDTSFGMPYIWTVIKHDDVERLKTLLKQGLTINDRFCRYGKVLSGRRVPGIDGCRTMAALACLNNATNCLDELVKMGSDLTVRFEDGGSFLHCLACVKGEMAKNLAEKAMATSCVNVDDENVYGGTPLFYSLSKGNLGFSKWLEMHGAGLNKWKVAGPGERESYFAQAMRFPYGSFEFVVDRFDIGAGNGFPPDELFACLDFRAPDCKRRVMMLLQRGVRLNASVGDAIVHSLVRDIPAEGNQVLGVEQTAEILSMLVECGLPVSCIRRALNYADSSVRKALEQFLGGWGSDPSRSSLFASQRGAKEIRRVNSDYSHWGASIKYNKMTLIANLRRH